MRAHELRLGDILVGSGWRVFAVQELGDNERVRVDFIAVGGRPRSKTYGRDERVEVVRAR